MRSTVHTKLLLLLLCAVLGLKLLYLVQLRASPLSTFLVEDHLVYQQRAVEILSGNLVGDAPPFYSSTLYPYLLAAIYAAAGVSPIIVYLVQLLLGTATCCLLYLLGIRVFGPRRALIAAALAGLYGPFVFAEGQLVMISWAVFAVVLALLAAACHARSGRIASAFLCGAACGLAAADRPNLFVLAGIVPLWWWLIGRRLRFAALAALAAGIGLILFPIMARNAAATGGRFLLSASSGINLAIGNHPGADGTYREPWPSGGHGTSDIHGLQEASRYHAGRALGRPVTDLEADRYWRRTALSYIVARPLEVAWLTGRKILLLLNHEEIPNVMSFDFYRAQFPSLRLFAAGFWIVAPFGLLSALMAVRGSGGVLALLAFLLLYGLSIVPFFVCDRFRLPAAPVLILFAADGMATLYETLRGARRGRALLLVGSLVPLVGLESLPLTHYDLSRDHWMLAEALVERGDLEAAIGEYRAVVAIRPDLGGAWTDLGFVQARLGRLAEARASFEKAVQVSPGLADSHAAIADIDRGRGAIDAAIAGYRRAVDLDPSLIEAWISLARLLDRDGETALARQTLLRGRALNPGAARFDEALREMGGPP